MIRRTKKSSLRITSLLSCIVLFILFPITSTYAQSHLINPETDLEYLGAFRLPKDTSGGRYGWNYSLGAMTYYPKGDPNGSADGYPGSLFASNHTYEQYIAEISIPAPVNSKNLNDLNRATTLQNFHNVRGGLLNTGYPYFDIEYLPKQGDQSSDKIYLAFSDWYNTSDSNTDRYVWFDLDLSNPDTQGAWHLGNVNPHQVADFLFEIPKSWADANTPGKRLLTGKSRAGHRFGWGPAMHTYGPWNHGNPPSPGTVLDVTTLLEYGNDDAHQLRTPAGDGYSVGDYWSGGAWITAGEKSAVVLFGMKGFGEDWYGERCGGKGWHALGGYKPYMLFYDPNDLADVANGIKETWEPQPYAVVDGSIYTFNQSSSQCSRIRFESAGYDREHGLLYVGEPKVDGDTPIIHVFKIVSTAQNDYSLQVTKDGTGDGTVTSHPAGINCGSDCAEDYNYGTVVTLSASADAGSAFTGWSGERCSGTTSCQVTMDQIRNINATFDVITYTITASAGVGGTITPSGVVTVAEDADQTFMITPTGTYQVEDVEVDGVSQGAVTTYTFSNVLADHAITAKFSTISTSTLSVNKSGDGQGSVSSNPAGIACGEICGAEFKKGTTLRLTATAESGSEFIGWSGAGCSGIEECVVTMDQAQVVTATFRSLPVFHPLTITKAGDGTGTITSNPAGIECGTTCSAEYKEGTQVMLTAVADPGSIFEGWSGACGGTEDCVVTTDEAQAVTATFEPDDGDVLIFKEQSFKFDRGGDASSPFVYRGDIISYAITATNLFEEAITLMISDSLSALVDYVAGTLTVNREQVADTYFSNEGLLEYESDPLNKNEFLTIAFDVMVKDDAVFDEVIENFASVTANFIGSPDPIISNKLSNTVSAHVKDQGMASTPEPSTFIFFAIGLSGVTFIRWRRQRNKK